MDIFDVKSLPTWARRLYILTLPISLVLHGLLINIVMLVFIIVIVVGYPCCWIYEIWTGKKI